MSVIEIKNLKKHFGRTRAVDDISFSVERGEIFGFLGPNGAGKTTTIRCLMDFIRPTAGMITVLGQDAQNESTILKKKIGYLSGNVRLYDKWTGQDHLDFVQRLGGKENMAEELIRRFDFNPKVKFKQLSSGNRQKLGIILAFMFRPEVLILDEPTLGLDPLLQNEVYKLLEELRGGGSTIFMSSHNLSEVDHICTRVGIIKGGRMVAIENIRDLKGKHMYIVHAYFAEKFDKNVFMDERLQITKELPNGLIMEVKGDLNALLNKLNHYKIRDLRIEHASLEHIFLEFYEK